MNFLSVQFAFFLAAAFVAFHLCPPRYRHVVLLAASYAFYFLSSRFVIAGIIGVTVFTFFLAQSLEPKLLVDSGRRNPSPRVTIMGLTVATLVCYLAFFKAIIPLRRLLTNPTITPQWLATFVTANSLLPLGISHYTFRLISYVLDVYWEKIPAERNFIDFAAYVSFFPHIVAGPIQRSGDFLEQIRAPRGPRRHN